MDVPLFALFDDIETDERSGDVRPGRMRLLRIWVTRGKDDGDAAVGQAGHGRAGGGLRALHWCLQLKLLPPGVAPVCAQREEAKRSGVDQVLPSSSDRVSSTCPRHTPSLVVLSATSRRPSARQEMAPQVPGPTRERATNRYVDLSLAMVHLRPSIFGATSGGSGRSQYWRRRSQRGLVRIP